MAHFTTNPATGFSPEAGFVVFRMWEAGVSTLEGTCLSHIQLILEPPLLGWVVFAGQGSRGRGLNQPGRVSQSIVQPMVDESLKRVAQLNIPGGTPRDELRGKRQSN